MDESGFGFDNLAFDPNDDNFVVTNEYIAKLYENQGTQRVTEQQKKYATSELRNIRRYKKTRGP